jgi:hypothetical protein
MEPPDRYSHHGATFLHTNAANTVSLTDKPTDRHAVTATFTLDVAGRLTQVLADETHTYVYGKGWIAQYTGATLEYFIPYATACNGRNTIV